MRGLRFIAPVVIVLLAAAAPWPRVSDRGIAATAHPAASRVAARVLAEGGHAVDAAVAATFAISVVEPYSAGIGGGGFALVHLEKTGEMRALDFRERAPLAATADMYKGGAASSINGYLSVAVPGTVAGLRALHGRYGRLPWARLIAPAVRLAEEGFVVDDLMALELRDRKDVLTKYPASRAIFAPKGRLLRAGARLKQPDLARVLRRLQKDPADFYRGEIAAVITRDMAANGGLVGAKDLASYSPTWRVPLCGDFRGHRVCSMPPPSSGGVHLLQILKILEDGPLGARGFHADGDVHLTAEAMRFAYADRSRWLGDPAFSEVPVKALLRDAYLSRRRAQIDDKKVARSSVRQPAAASWLRESKDTSHLTVVDRDKNAVSLTFTVNWSFGSGVVVPGTGILLNDEMDDFAADPGKPNVYGLVGGEANAVAPAKIPLSSMSPTIVTKAKKLALATGASGGSTIITSVLQIVINRIVFKMNASEAVAAPRFHHQWLPDELRLERFGFDPLTKAALQKRGHNLVERRTWGNSNVVVVREDGRLEGAADPRGMGRAVSAGR